MAEVVRALRVDGLSSSPAAPVALPEQSVDPVCGMTVLIGPDTPHVQIDATDHWFCCPGCLDRYVAA